VAIAPPAFAVLAFGTPARAAAPAAAPPRYTPFVERGMAVPAPYTYGTLGWSAISKRGRPTQVEGSIGGGIGLSPRVWLDGTMGVVRVAPEGLFHSPLVGLGARLFDSPGLEVDAALHVGFASEDKRPVEIVEPGVFAVGRVGHALRFDGGLYLQVNPGSPNLPTTLGMRAPAAAAFQIVEKVYAQVTTGATVGSFADASTVAVPLGVTVGWSDHVGSSGASIGLLPSINFPELVKPGAQEHLRPSYWVVGVTFVAVTSY
jgi:hypothetical protein